MENPPLTLKELKKLYDERVNIMGLFRELTGSSQNSVDAILVSYDLQSGSYARGIEDPARKEMLHRYTAAIAAVLDRFPAASILEAGVGEATTLSNVIAKLKRPPKSVHGFDISWSRIDVAREYAARFEGFAPTLFTGDLFHIPAPDSAFDLVFTAHAIEPNFGRERKALAELYRVARRWLVLFKPSYELGSDATKLHIEKHGYCRNLRGVAEELGCKVIEHRLHEFSYVPHNQARSTNWSRRRAESDDCSTTFPTRSWDSTGTGSSNRPTGAPPCSPVGLWTNWSVGRSSR